MTQVTVWSKPIHDRDDLLRAEIRMMADEVKALVRAAYPLPGEPVYDEADVSEVTEFRARSTDGVVRPIDAREAVESHRHGLKVESRKVWTTAWEEATR